MKRKLIVFLVLAVMLVGGAGGGYFYYKHYYHKPVAKNETGDVYVKFLGEIWDKIKTSYWDKEPDDQLANLYKLGAEKIIGKPQNLETNSRDGAMKMVTAAMKDMDNAKKKEFVTQLADVVLANLQPFGRSRLMGEKQQQALVDTVQNKDTNTDLYAALGVNKDATPQEVNKAYEQKVKTVDTKTTDGQKQLADLTRAKEALGSEANKQVYDQSGIEPTVIYHNIGSKTFYMHIKKVSPQTFDEFQKAVNSTEKETQLESLIVDLRGNVGGAIDILPYFLGPFLGPNSYAYDFFHQGDYTPYKTKIGWMPALVKFKKVVVLIDDQAQSSAEVMAASLKKYNVGVLVGTHTKGWGTVEQLMPMDTQLDSSEKYTMLMVTNITLRDDGQPIEGHGVDPTISIDDKNWQKQLLGYFNLPYLVDAVKTALTLKN